jgi:hypothetical protein
VHQHSPVDAETTTQQGESLVGQVAFVAEHSHSHALPARTHFKIGGAGRP